MFFREFLLVPAKNFLGFSVSKKSAARKFAVEVVIITCVFVHNVLQWRYMKLVWSKENIMDFLDKEQVIVVIICGILIIIGLSI